VYSAELQRLLGSRGNLRIVAAFVRKVLDPATRRDGNGKASKVQSSIGQYVVRQQAGTLGGMHTSGKVSVTGKESSEYAPHSSTANHIQSAPTRTANVEGNAGSEDGWSKDRKEQHPGSEEDETARPAVSGYQRDRILGHRVTAKNAFARPDGVASRRTICS